ncbi:MAG: hypothetical protein H6581_08555 [Bacteroidia bacterium]|nr:hypothetical protein [Bacteroidia bacterium]
MENLSLAERIEKLGAFKTALLRLLRSQETLDLAIRRNPWFSEWDIREAVSRLLPWFEGNELAELASRYDFSKADAKNIGIIMAGNVPLVGFHDLLMTLLAGHRALVKYSGKDNVLLPWILDQVFGITPFIKGRVREFSPRKKIDLLLATGSNNTARQLDYQFRDTNRIIRKNRFSVAVLSGNEDVAELRGLTDDLFLYNGMGCRNPSVLLIPAGYEPGPLFAGWDELPEDRFSSWYLSLMQQELALADLEGKGDWKCRWLIGKRLRQIMPEGPGWLGVVEYANEQHLGDLLQLVKDELQVVAGREVLLGKAQSPQVGDFADGLDTLEVLARL